MGNSSFSRLPPFRRDKQLLCIETEIGELQGELHGPQQWALGSELSKSADTEITVKLHADVKQEILGFGAALTEASAANICTSPHRDDILDDLFLPASKGGAGLSLVRLCIGSSDFALDAVTPQTEEGATCNFDRYLSMVLPVIQAARTRNPKLSFIASPWSAPHWMKSSKSLVGGTLEEKWMDQYCHYFLRFLLFFQGQGVHISAVTLQNEPDYGDASYPCMYLTTSQEAMLGRKLVALLRANGVSTLVLGHDHNYNIWERAVELLGHCGDAIDGTAWHAYSGSPQALQNDTIQRHGIYFTEQTAHTKRPRDADFKDDINWMMANVLLGPVSFGSRCGLSWNLALDEHFGPVLEGGPRNCRGVVEVGASGKHERSPEFYALAHMCHATASGPNERCFALGSHISGEGVTAGGFACTDGTCSAILHNKTNQKMQVKLKCGKVNLAAFEMHPDSIVSVSGLKAPPDISENVWKAKPTEPTVPPAPFELPSRFSLQNVDTNLFVHASASDENILLASSEGAYFHVFFAARLPDSPRLFALRTENGSLLSCDSRGYIIQTRNWFDKLTFAMVPISLPDSVVGFCSDAGLLCAIAGQLCIARAPNLQGVKFRINAT